MILEHINCYPCSSSMVQQEQHRISGGKSKDPTLIMDSHEAEVVRIAVSQFNRPYVQWKKLPGAWGLQWINHQLNSIVPIALDVPYTVM